MATSTIRNNLLKLSHLRILVSQSTPIVVTNSTQTVRTGPFYKAQQSTTLYVQFMCYGYVDSLSGGFYFAIDGENVASAITVNKTSDNAISSAFFVEDIPAGDHTYSIVVATQGANTFTVPAWTNNVITVSELL